MPSICRFINKKGVCTFLLFFGVVAYCSPLVATVALAVAPATSMREAGEFDPAEVRAPIEPWREFAIDLDRLFGPYEKGHRFTLRVESQGSGELPHPWFNMAERGYANVLAPEPLPRVFFPPLGPETAATAVANYVQREWAWRDYSLFLIALLAAAAVLSLVVLVYGRLLIWAERPRSPQLLRRGMRHCEAFINYCDQQVQTLCAEFPGVARSLTDIASNATAILFSLLVREYRRLCAQFTKARHLATISRCRVTLTSLRLSAGSWWTSSWTWRLRMTRLAARRCETFVARTLWLLARPLVASYEASWTRRYLWARRSFRLAMVWCAILVIALPPLPMQAFADTVIFDSNALLGDGVTESSPGPFDWNLNLATFINGGSLVATTNDLLTDVAQFGNGGTLGSAATINVGSQSIRGLIVGANTTSGYLLTASSVSQVLSLGASGITLNSGAQATTIGSANLGLSLGANQTWTNNSANLLTVGGAVGLGSNTLTISNLSTGGQTFAGVISGNGGVAINSSGVGVTTFSGANVYTGDTTLSGGTLKLDFSAAGAPQNNIINNTAVSSKLSLRGGTLNVNGAGTAVANTQQFNDTDIVRGVIRSLR